MEKAVKSEQIYNSFSVNSLAGSVPTLHLQSPMKTMLFKTVSEPNLNIYLRCVHLYVLVDLAAKRLENGKIKNHFVSGTEKHLWWRWWVNHTDSPDGPLYGLWYKWQCRAGSVGGHVRTEVLKWWAAQGYWWLMMMATHTHWIHQFPHSKWTNII